MNRQALLDGMAAAAANARDDVARIRRDMDQQTLTHSRLKPRMERLAVNLAIFEQGLQLLDEPEFAVRAPALRAIPGGRT